MPSSSRRSFLRHTGMSFAAGLAGGSLTLPAGAQPTPAARDADVAERILKQMGHPPEALRLKDGIARTKSRALGPFYRESAPFRGKASPPFAEGQALVVSGRVWAYDTRRPLPGALLDVWHVDHEGRYSDGDGDFRNRVRLIASESGAYEFESTHPVAYPASPEFWRSPHIHFICTSPGYDRLVSEMFFEGDPRHDTDALFHPALCVPVARETIRGQPLERAVFDIILVPESSARGG